MCYIVLCIIYTQLHGVTQCYTVLNTVTHCYMVLYGVAWCYMALYIHTYIHTKIYFGTLASTTRADFHEGREFRKKAYYTDKRFKIIQNKEKRIIIYI